MNSQESECFMAQKFQKIIDGLWLVEDICNVYIVQCNQRAVAIDFGSGNWFDDLGQIGVEYLDHVFLTHHHVDQCSGLQDREFWPFTIHAPAGEEDFLDHSTMRQTGSFSRFDRGCPKSYSVLKDGLGNVVYDIRSHLDFLWLKKRIRFLATPGHGPNACSIIIDIGEKQIVFCGDAAYEGGTLWQPFHLEWDHYSTIGTIAAWQGIKRLAAMQIDLLCPSHGSIIDSQPNAKLNLLAERLMKLHDVKQVNYTEEKDLYLDSELLSFGGAKLFEHLYQFGQNGYLLLSSSGQALIVDPFGPDMEIMERLLGSLGGVKPTAVVVTHYHSDHCDGIEYLRQHYGAKAYLHPQVARPLANVDQSYIPWLPKVSISADELWPNEGMWQWNEYNFQIDHCPGQTWWHCCFMILIDGRKVFFSGDNFTPLSRYGGGCVPCSFNNGRLEDGYLKSAELVLKYKPDVIASGHWVYYHFTESRFRKIIQWAHHASDVIRQLCPTGDIEKDYYNMGVEPGAITKESIVRKPKGVTYLWAK